MNCQISGDGMNSTNISNLLIEFDLHNTLPDPLIEPRETSIKWTAPLSPTVIKQMYSLIAKLDESKDFEKYGLHRAGASPCGSRVKPKKRCRS